MTLQECPVVTVATIVTAACLTCVWLAGIIAWLAGRRHLRRTTLVPAWWWTGAALLSLGAVELLVRGAALPEGLSEPLRFAAAALTFGPVMAVLGARRPQHRAWVWIVASLWVILVLPCAELLLLQEGGQLQIHGARSWFLAALIFVSATHLLATRFWPSALLLAAGQSVLLAPYLPGLRLLSLPWGDQWRGAAGLSLCAAALGAAWLPRSRQAAAPLDQLWLDFRDQFGVLWSLRLAEQFNAASASARWGLQLQWNGFRAADGGPAPTRLEPHVAQPLETCLRNLLRRFVSTDWIDQRLQGGQGSDKVRG